MPADFDPTTHTYRIDGKIVPGVTSIIRAILPGFQATYWYLTRGKAAHRACELLDQGRLDWLSVDPEIMPRVRAWEQFRKDFGGTVVANELPLTHSVYRYGGTLDRVLYKDGRLVQIDLKNSVEPQVRLQLGFYSILWTAHEPLTPISCAGAVELMDNGRYRCYPDKFLSGSDLRWAEKQALALLTVYGFAEKHGLLRKEPNERPACND